MAGHRRGTIGPTPNLMQATSSTTPPLSIGVDLGTTYFCVAHCDKDRVETVQIDYGQDVAATVVRCTARTWTLPSPTDRPSHSAAHIGFAKRIIGRSREDGMLQHDTQDIPHAQVDERGACFDVHGKRVTPVEVSAFVLGRVGQGVESHYGRSIDNLVVAVPAFFATPQKLATEDAVEMAGFGQARVRLVEEPVAAVVEFVESQAETVPSKSTIVVVDIGGGTTDVTEVYYESTESGPSYVVKATGGDNRLGGHDLDKVLVKHVVAAIARSLRAKVDHETLLLRCESAKRQLSQASNVDIEVPMPDRDDPVPLTVPVTRSEFEDMSQTVRQRIANIIDGLPCRKVDNFTGHVVLAGGSCAVPFVRTLCQEKFPDATIANLKYSEVVARGAARIAAKPQMVLVPVLPRSIGVEVVHLGCDSPFTEVIMKRNTQLPRKVTHRLQTAKEDQSAIEFKIQEGESRVASLNTTIGCFEITDIPSCASGTPITVLVHIPEPGAVDVTATIGDHAEGQSKSLTVNQRRRLEDAELKSLKKLTSDRLDGRQDAGDNTGARPVKPRRTIARGPRKSTGGETPRTQPKRMAAFGTDSERKKRHLE